MVKVPAVVAGSLLLVFVFWYQSYIRTECVSLLTCSRRGPQADNALRNQPGTSSRTRDTHGEVRGERRLHEKVSSAVGSGNTTNISTLESEPFPGDKHIIFIETGCLLGGSHGPDYQGLTLHKRQACVIESAAKMNPNHKVYLLYSCPINGKLADSSEHVRPIFAYPNVKLWRLNVTRQLSGTPLETWNFHAAMESSSWPREHSSDVLRLVALWKYGGTYLDLDVIVLRCVRYGRFRKHSGSRLRSVKRKCDVRLPPPLRVVYLPECFSRPYSLPIT
jgi:hypothetical protein